MSFFHELAHQYIDGEWLTGSGSWDIIDFNPYNGEKLAAVTVATALEVDRAYRAAERAQREWASVNPYERRAVLERALRITGERAEEIAEAIIDELGGTRPRARYEVDSATEFLREAIRQALRPTGTPAARRGGRPGEPALPAARRRRRGHQRLQLPFPGDDEVRRARPGARQRGRRETPSERARRRRRSDSEDLRGRRAAGRAAQRRHHRQRRDRRRVHRTPRAQGDLLHRLRPGPPAHSRHGGGLLQGPSSN
ncbi:NAD/NADP-dependent betaine aldehyde dehydrogenase [Streptomyces badius]